MVILSLVSGLEWLYQLNIRNANTLHVAIYTLVHAAGRFQYMYTCISLQHVHVLQPIQP